MNKKTYGATSALKKNFLFVFFLFMLLLCIGSVSVSFWAVHKAESLHGDLTKEQIYELKRTFLKDTVHNVLSDIDEIRAKRYKEIKEKTDIIINAIALSSCHTQELDLKALDTLLSDPLYKKYLYIRIKDVVDNSLVYTSENISTINTTTAADPSIAYSVSKKTPFFLIDIFVDIKWVDSIVVQDVRQLLYSQNFENNSYIWINEVINWDGGEGYAIRRIHPNLKDTEGMLLSTEMEDIVGNKPYLDELKGIRESGSLFSRYYFKRLNSDEISEKITYACLYEDYDWIVAMGISINDLDYFVNKVKESSGNLDNHIVIVSTLLIIVFFIAVMVLLLLTGGNYLRHTSEEIRSEANRDPLTGALNRRIGNDYLRKIFMLFKRDLVSPAIFSMDIDDFKKVNDTYGHDAGDIVLHKVVDVIKDTMREVDYLFRWGGEEFLLVCNSKEEKTSLTLARRLNVAIEETDFEVSSNVHDPATCMIIDNLNPQNNIVDTNNACLQPSTQRIKVTISIGISWFGESDTSFLQALKRSDTALYEAKEKGKNTYVIKAP